MNIFNAIKVYSGKWQVKNTRSFTQEEMNAIQTASVVDSQYGLSVCFILRSGGQSYIPLDQNSNKAVGEIIDLSQAKLVTLGREGDNDIYRVSC